ncbi:MAG: twin-arginine translocation signal domain-containing protein [Candidatus Sulfopaludibacter sp.]|nr:twin-arginine translocation signal domain-containing protein [Candidatus Sulfopaludibacter sp.]
MSKTERRGFLRRAAALAAAAPTLNAEDSPALAFSNRAHLFAHPKVKEKLTWCFTEILGCGAPVSLHAPGLAEPILAFRFPGGGSLSIEFTLDALDEAQVRRGAWLEIRAANPPALKKKILDAGLPEVRYPATTTFYFAAPGGQVFGVAGARNPSAGELRTGK